MSFIAIPKIGLNEPSNNKVGGWFKWFILSAGWILLITGLAKIVSVCGHAAILGMNDPILGISFRSLMLIAGLIELAISGLCLMTTKYRLNLAMVTWIASVFLGYRFGLYYVHWHRPCPCLGNLIDSLGISPSLADLLMALISVYLFVGSTFIWIIIKKYGDCLYGKN